MAPLSVDLEDWQVAGPFDPPTLARQLVRPFVSAIGHGQGSPARETPLIHRRDGTVYPAIEVC